MEPSQLINILVVDDNYMLIKALGNVFRNSEYLNIIGNCSRESEISPFIKRNKIDVILMEFMTEKVNGFEAMKRIRERDPKIKIIVFSYIAEIHFVQDVMDSGADGFISKYDTNKELMEKELFRVMRLEFLQKVGQKS
jgi:DNA-binding NarL/FixJ family response regulator